MRTWVRPVSRAHGTVVPIDVVTTDLDDAARTAAEAERAGSASRKGLSASRQIDSVNRAFPSLDTEPARAWRAVKAVDGAAGRIDGQMIDEPRLEPARRLLGQEETT